MEQENLTTSLVWARFSMGWIRIFWVPNIILERTLRSVSWIGCQTELKMNLCMWVAWLSKSSCTLLHVGICTFFMKSLLNLFNDMIIYFLLSIKLIAYPAPIHIEKWIFCVLFMFLEEVCCLSPYCQNRWKCSYGYYLFQHWTSIQELVRHFWSSYPITTAYLYNKVIFLSFYKMFHSFWAVGSWIISLGQLSHSQLTLFHSWSNELV